MYGLFDGAASSSAYTRGTKYKTVKHNKFYYIYIPKAACFDFYRVIIRPFFKRTDPTYYGL